jgi:hypothetical protein
MLSRIAAPEILSGPSGPVVLSPVLDGPVPHLVVGRDPAGGAECAETLGRAHDLFAQVLQVLIEPWSVGDREAPCAADGDGFEVLRTHYGAQPGPAHGASILSIHHDRGEAHELLAGRADACHSRLLAAPPCLPDLVTHPIVRLERIPAPQVCRLAQLDLTVVDPEINGPLGPAAYDEGVETSLLEVVGPVAATFGLAPNAGQRATGADAEAV